MRTKSWSLVVSLSSISAAGCAHTRSREDALWHEVRELERAQAAHAEPVTFAMERALDRGELVTAVLARNPSIAAAREGLRASLAEVPQVSTLPDPRLSYDVAPLTLTAADVPFGQRITLRQALPFPGKRGLAGDAALASAEVDAAEIDVVRIELAQMASDLYDDYFVSARALEINTHHQRLLEQIKKSAEAQYVVGRAAQQDPIQAEVELAQLERERIMIESERDQVVARLNGLLHRPVAAPVPPPPAELALAAVPAGSSADLQDLALQQRPQHKLAGARIRAARAKVAVAERAFYPDFEVMGSYDSMWAMSTHQWMVGVMIDLPIQRAGRRAAVEQAEATVVRARFEDERLADDIRVDVDRAYRRVVEAEALVAVHVDKLLPAARAQVDSARVGFTSAQNSFLAVVGAQNNLRQSELSLAIARAELSRRRAALARAVGLVPGMPEGGAR